MGPSVEPETARAGVHRAPEPAVQKLHASAPGALHWQGGAKICYYSSRVVAGRFWQVLVQAQARLTRGTPVASADDSRTKLCVCSLHASSTRARIVPSSWDSTSVSQLAPVWVEGHLQMVPLASTGHTHSPVGTPCILIVSTRRHWGLAFAPLPHRKVPRKAHPGTVSLP